MTGVQTCALPIWQEGIPAAWIGTVTEGVAREVFYGKVHRYMDRPREDPLYKIIERKMLE